MLEQMRRKGASVFIYLIFGLLIVIFVINFAPSGQGQGGCKGPGSSEIDVDGVGVPNSAFQVAYSGTTIQGTPFAGARGRERVYAALETLIRRELLAQAAEERGLRATRELVEEEIKNGFLFIGGLRIPLEENIFDLHADGTKTWNIRKFKALVSQIFQISPNAYIDEQVRGLQATLMAEMLASSAQVSRDEALSMYLFTRNTVTYDLVSFSPTQYRAAMLLTDADVDRYLAAHEDQVKARHKETEREYADRKPELKLRQIFIAKAEDKAAETKPGETKPADPKAPADAKPAAPKVTEIPAPKVGDAAPGVAAGEAKAKLEAVRAAVVAGKQKFADAAKQLNTLPALRANGGSVGWRTADNASLGEKAVSDAVKDLKPGEMTPVISGENGTYLVLAEEKREKALTYEQVKHEIAAELAREAWSKEAAKRDALKAFEAARGGKNLGDLFAREAGAPGAASTTPPAAMGELPKDAKTPALAPSAEVLPAFSDAKPKVQQITSRRLKTLQGLDAAGIKTVFDELAKTQIANRIMESDGNFNLVQLVERGEGKIEEFDKDADQLISRMREMRGRLLVEDWLKARCTALDKDGKIKPMPARIAESDEKGKPKATVYRPCMYLL